MASPITGSQSSGSGQLTLQFETDLVHRFRNVRDVVAHGVYRRSLKSVAADLDMAPGNLSCMLSDESQRKFCVDDLERYIQTQGDVTPILFLVAKYLGDRDAEADARAERIEALLSEVAQLLPGRGKKR